MRLAFIADGQSPIARGWIEYFVAAGHEVHWITTSALPADLPLASVVRAPVAFTGQAGRIRTARHGPLASLRGARTLPLRVFLRHWLGPVTVPSAARVARRAIAEIRPDLVHALRVPFEGMLAAAAKPDCPLLLSVWGNDFTFHAPSSPLMALLTRRTLQRADALHTDCRRDLRLAHHWGFPAGRAGVVLPGNGGVRPEVFYPRGQAPYDRGPLLRPVLTRIPPQTPVVINPRGFRAYVRSDTFFRSVPLILGQHPAARFLCPAMADDPLAEGWLRRLDIGHAVHLLPPLSAMEMASAFRRAVVAVSPSLHDGTPNTILEAMACGCVPVVGDLESLREWIEDDLNGLLVDPTDPSDLARAVNRALADPAWRSQAARRNAGIIAERAAYPEVTRAAEAFYRQIAA